MISGLKMKNCPILKESDKEESYDLSDMPPLGDEKVKLDPEETTTYKVKLNAQKKKQEQD